MQNIYKEVNDDNLSLSHYMSGFLNEETLTLATTVMTSSAVNNPLFYKYMSYGFSATSIAQMITNLVMGITSLVTDSKNGTPMTTALILMEAGSMIQAILQIPVSAVMIAA